MKETKPRLNLVFVSHLSKDAGAATAHVVALKERGITCWVSPRGVPPGSRHGE